MQFYAENFGLSKPMIYIECKMKQQTIDNHLLNLSGFISTETLYKLSEHNCNLVTKESVN